MTPQHNYPQGGSAAGRGIVIVIVAISLGVYLLAQAFDDGASEASEGAASGQSEEITVADGDDDDEGDPEDTGASGVTTTTTTTTTTTI